MVRSGGEFGGGVGRWSVRVSLLAVGTVLFSGAAAAQQVQQAEYTGPDTMTVALFAGGAAFLGALVANLAWKAISDDGSDAATTPGRAHQPSGAQSPPAGDDQQYQAPGTDAGGRQGQRGSGGANEGGGAGRGR